MNLVRFGTDYGGWTVDLDRVPETGVVIDAGIGTDLSFADALHEVRPDLKFVGVDHTEESRDFVAKRSRPWYSMICGAIDAPGCATACVFVGINGGSESTHADHQRVRPNYHRIVPRVDLAELIEKHKPCLVKLDIEGSEREVLFSCLGVPQIAVEFHEKMIPSHAGFRDEAIKKFESSGYEVVFRTPTDEVTMVKR